MVFFLARRIEALVKKGIVSHARERHFFQIASWDNSVGVNIVALDRNRCASDFRDLDNLAHGPFPTDTHASQKTCRSMPTKRTSKDSLAKCCIRGLPDTRWNTGLSMVSKFNVQMT